MALINRLFNKNTYGKLKPKIILSLIDPIQMLLVYIFYGLLIATLTRDQYGEIRSQLAFAYSGIGLTLAGLNTSFAAWLKTKIYRDPDAYPHLSVGTLPFQAVILFGYYYIFSSLYSYAPAWRSAFSLCCVLIAFEILILSLLDATFLVARRYKTLLILSLSPLLTKLLPVLILVCIPYKSISSLLFSFALGSLAFICCGLLVLAKDPNLSSIFFNGELFRSLQTPVRYLQLLRSSFSQQKGENLLIYLSFLLSSLLTFAPIFVLTKLFSLADVASWTNCIAIITVLCTPFTSYYSRKILSANMINKADAFNFMKRQSILLFLFPVSVLLLYAGAHTLLNTRLPGVSDFVQERLYVDFFLLSLFIGGFVFSMPARLIRLILSLPIYCKRSLESALSSITVFAIVTCLSFKYLGHYSVIAGSLTADLAVVVIFIYRFSPRRVSFLSRQV